ncbi:MAG: hypothetical protein GX128_09190 [Bacteroidales bacterium]|nr:hypothetical protein [Bacteroidales bacterium]
MTFTNFSAIRNLLPKPEEQSRIAKILSDRDNKIEALENKLENYKMIK